MAATLKRAGILVFLVAAAVFGWSRLPSKDERVQARLERLKALPPERFATWLERRRPELLVLLSEARRQGDERNASWLATRLIDAALTPAELDELARITLSDADSWNTVLPEWRKRILARWIEADPARRAGLEAARPLLSEDILLEFRPSRRYPRLFLEGSWNAAGELDDLGGWGALPLSEGGGVWTRRLKLRKTAYSRVYHAIVRTQPWPAGKAIGWVTFPVRRTGRVAFSEETLSVAEAPVAVPASGKKVRLALLLPDGASWQVLLPLIHAGRLPNLSRMLREGGYASMYTSGEKYPSVPNIYSALTGLLPFRHGLTDFTGMNLSSCPRPLWEMVTSAGGTAAVAGMHATFPPNPSPVVLATDAFFALRIKEVFNVSLINLEADVVPFARQFGMSRASVRAMLRLLDRFAHHLETTEPPGLAEELRRALPRPEWSRSSMMLRLAEIFDAQVGSAAVYLADRSPFDFLAIKLSATDTAGHVFFDAFAPAAGGRPAQEPGFAPFASAFESTDRLIGELMARSEHVLVMSDHGFGIPAYETIESVEPLRVLGEFYRQEGLGPQGLVVTQQIERWNVRFPGATGRLAPKLAEFLKSARYANDRPVFPAVAQEAGADGDVVAFGWQAPEPPWAGAVSVRGKHVALRDLFKTGITGVHQGNAMLALWGPKVRHGALPQPLLIADITPTVLYLLGYPIASDLDGKLAEGLLRPGELERSPARETSSYGRQAHPARRLLRAVRWRSFF